MHNKNERIFPQHTLVSGIESITFRRAYFACFTRRNYAENKGISIRNKYYFTMNLHWKSQAQYTIWFLLNHFEQFGRIWPLWTQEHEAESQPNYGSLNTNTAHVLVQDRYYSLMQATLLVTLGAFLLMTIFSNQPFSVVIIIQILTRPNVYSLIGIW